jgi:hypothetical protein
VAKFITFNGVTLYHPGGLTKVDASGMAQVGAGASGIVGVIGEADYGQPYDPAGGSPKIYTFTDPDAAAETFKSGPLADSIDFLFNPSNDVRIPGGTQQLIAIKSNIDARSSVVAQNQAADAVSLTFTSIIYGQYANALSVKVARNEANTDTLDVTVTDGNTATVETFTQICGTPLLDVQYAPSTPAQVGSEYTTDAGAAAANVLAFAAVPGTITASDEGRYVQITGSATQAHLVGQVRRIRSGGVGATTLTLAGDFCDAAGAASANPATGTIFRIIREAIGPFYVNSYVPATTIVTVEGHADDQPALWSAGDPLFWAAAADVAHYADSQNGPCYMHIVSGTGAGQIRRITVATSSTPLRNNTFTVQNGFETDPDNTSQFVFINAVPKNTAGVLDAPTATGGNAMGEGAFGVIAGAGGISNSLSLQVRPGFGEPATHGGASVTLGNAGPARAADWTYTLSTTLNINALVTALNNGTVISGAATGVDATIGSWKARVGLGRDGALPTSRFDFTGRANGAYTGAATAAGVDCLCDFETDHPVNKETGDFGTNPNRYHRFTDNLMLLIDTLNAQSQLVNAARATAVGVPAGANFGDGVTAFATFALTGGAYNATTAAGLAACFDELIKYRQDTAVALWSSDTAAFTIDYVHALLAQHAKNGAGAYKNEVDCIAAIQPTSGSTYDVALNLIKTKATILNDRNVALVFQDIKRAGLTGSVVQFEPHMLACAAAGMQAGSTVGTPLTFKLVRTIEIICNNTRVDALDRNTSDELLKSGVFFAEKVKGQGYRIVRNLSTYTATDNVAYTDRNVNYELNYMAYDLRTFIENRFTGVKATPAVVASVKSSVITKLEVYKNDLEIIVDSQDLSTGATLNAYRNLKVTISGDICTIRFEIFPAVGINYITFEIFAQLPTLSA